ncbi:MAG TPA: LysE family translocator [Actinomycetes bacterium]|jgi:threonine/homoserine/homoserine lactone efflux protein
MTDRLLGFAGVCVLLTFVPGVDTAMVTRSALARGSRAGVQTALGAASGLFVHAAAVALGVSALLARSAAGFEVLRLCGACYLVGLGVLTLRRAGRGHDPDGAELRRLPRLGPFAQGLLTNLTNPKAALLFLTLLPQFLSPSWSSGRALPLALATIPATCSFTGLSLYALGLGRLRPLLQRPRVRRLQDRLVGCVLVALGARLAAERA